MKTIKFLFSNLFIFFSILFTESLKCEELKHENVQKFYFLQRGLNKTDIPQLENNNMLKYSFLDSINNITKSNNEIDNIKQNNQQMNNLNFSQPDSLKYINQNITYRNISTIQDLNLKNEIHKNEIINNKFETNFQSSFIKSFSLLLVSEVMDKTFIIILYFSSKLSPFKTLFFSGVSLIFMNSISIIIGYSIPFLLYRSLIEWIAIISFIFMSFAYVNEANSLENETHFIKLNKTINTENKTRLREKRTNSIVKKGKFYFLKKDSITLINSYSTHPDSQEYRRSLIEKNPDEENSPICFTDLNQINTINKNIELIDSELDRRNDEKKIIYTLIYTILVAECGDRSQISSVLLASVFNFSGVMIGTTFALIISIILAVYFGDNISKYISEKYLNYIAGGFFFIFGIEILLVKVGYFNS